VTAGPTARGLLDVGDGHLLYWEERGAPDGKPAVALHGGPGSGCGPSWAGFFDLTHYRVLLFDQRGCGRSVPNAATDVGALEHNTTQRLVADIERLREHLKVERWLVLGGSWGSTLGLAYAEAHPEAVTEMVLFAVVTTTRREIEWVTHGVGRFFGEAWQRLRDGAGAGARDDELAVAYNELLLDPDPAVHERAAAAWCAWEQCHMGAVEERFADPAYRLCFARMVTHYWRHAAWLGEDELMDGVGRLGGIPAMLIHGEEDVSAPLDVPRGLAEAWPGSELVVVPGGGHLAGERMAEAISAAIRRYT
jgi:proline iminopeptidase